ncbi:MULTISPECIES: tetratricopeptide repeat protein [Treponema]|jgi:tetratricopeptide (TPR) repeat protein|uniref:Tetratricopeptide (TPR) repeat protein n=1 Tax=Treponema rectale TaxID=744512 RepID=A0A840SEL0_9SPIR|nr:MULTISPECIES: tetratricopeptide repeat protein [Treponema]MBB5218608.1 tetratricopeptide (TPR) repeat protein [Treponema rectale]
MMKENVEELNNNAIHLAQKGNFDEAVACFKRALTLDKENYLLWFNLALTYRDAGYIDKAISSMEKAHIMNPEDPEILETLANLNISVDRTQTALQYLFYGLSLNENNDHLWNSLGVLLFQNSEYMSACECFEHAVTINPFYYDAFYNLADCYDELGNKNAAQICREQLKNLTKGQS